MKAFRNRSLFEKGQSIVIFTVSLAVLLMLMSLVLDGGVLLLRRREAQASADSGALAGGAYICGNEVEASDYTAATVAANQYANDLNQATSSVVTFPETNTIQVVSTIIQTPALAGLMGFGDISVEALARARCQNAGTGTALMPFVFACEIPNPSQEDYEDCVQKIAIDPENPVRWDDPDPDKENEFYLVHNSDPEDESLWCVDPPNSIPPPPDGGAPSPFTGLEYDNGFWDCDFDDDGVDDVIDSANRGWVSLIAGTNPGTAELIDWILNGIGDAVITEHMWAGGRAGVANSIFQTIWELEGSLVLIPVFDDFCNETGDPETECPERWHEGDPQDITLTISGAQKYYHINAFAAFRITCVHAPPYTGCPYREYVSTQEGGDFLEHNLPATIEGFFEAIVSSDWGGGGTLDTGAYVVRLTR